MPKRKRAEASEPETKPPEKQATLPWAKNSSQPKTVEAKGFEIDSNGKEITCERRGTTKPRLIFTHGAGGGLSNAATKEFADGFAEVAPVVSFQGTMNLQSRVRSFQAVLEHEDVQCALGGRSMGARAAVLTAQQSNGNNKVLILVSYPMVGAQKGDSREQILLDLPEDIDVLFISGTKDSMCSISHLQQVMKKMKARSWVVTVQGADHGMSLGSKAGMQPLRLRTGSLAAQWLTDRDASTPVCSLSWSGGDRKVVSSGWLAKEGENGAAG